VPSADPSPRRAPADPTPQTDGSDLPWRDAEDRDRGEPAPDRLAGRLPNGATGNDRSAEARWRPPAGPTGPHPSEATTGAPTVDDVPATAAARPDGRGPAAGGNGDGDASGGDGTGGAEAGVLPSRAESSSPDPTVADRAAQARAVAPWIARARRVLAELNHETIAGSAAAEAGASPDGADARPERPDPGDDADVHT
jgi:hypothetical protein